MGVLGDLFDRVAGVIDNDFLGGDENADRGLESFHIESAIGRFELHQIERGEIAGGVVKKEIFAARIGRVLPATAFTGMPFVNGGIELHSRIAAHMCAFGDLAQQHACIFTFAR